MWLRENSDSFQVHKEKIWGQSTFCLYIAYWLSTSKYDCLTTVHSPVTFLLAQLCLALRPIICCTSASQEASFPRVSHPVERFFLWSDTLNSTALVNVNVSHGAELYPLRWEFIPGTKIIANITAHKLQRFNIIPSLTFIFYHFLFIQEEKWKENPLYTR